jgi:hypothetical protein
LLTILGPENDIDREGKHKLWPIKLEEIDMKKLFNVYGEKHKRTPLVMLLLVKTMVNSLNLYSKFIEKRYSLHPSFKGIIHKSCNPKIPPSPKHINI